jgi:hypothetical protein
MPTMPFTSPTLAIEMIEDMMLDMSSAMKKEKT